VCNPPYIASEQWQELAPEVVDFEPEVALRAGVGGMDFYRRICAEASDWLGKGGSLLLEVGHEQADPVSDLLREAAGSFRVTVHTDLAGIRRVVAAHSAGSTIVKRATI
jgi:release factor glutamine methyltransferase